MIISKSIRVAADGVVSFIFLWLPLTILKTRMMQAQGRHHLALKRSTGFTSKEGVSAFPTLCV